jgi:hypothetical protein
MIKIIQAHLREGEKGQFVSLELMGDIELVQSQNTGRFYATAKRCFINSTFNLETAKELVGQQLPGSISRVACDPYLFSLPEGGQTITLSHTYAYVPEVHNAVEITESSSKEMQEVN